MSNHIKKWIVTYRCILLQYLITLIFLLQITATTDINDEDAAAYKRAKRAFMQRAREYIKQNPISPELQEFIDRFKRSHTSTTSRSKREPNMLDQMYVMNQGNLLPFDPKRLKRQNFTDFNDPQIYKVNNDGEVVPMGHGVNQLAGELSTQDYMQNMTVVPLIIPIGLENNVTVAAIDNDAAGTTAGRRGRYSTDSDSTTEDLLPRQRLPISRQSYTKMYFDNSDGSSTGSIINTDETKGDTEMTLMIGPISATDRAKQVSMLNKVLDDIEDLINRQNGGKDYSSEGLACDLHGEWDSSSGGVLVSIQKNVSCDESGILAPVKIMEKDPPGDGFLRPANWNATGLVPFKRASLIVITATSIKGKKVISFIGECKICDGTEAILGIWQVARASSDCKDQKAARSLHQDVLRKSTISKLRSEHMHQLTSTPRPSSNIV